jgi:hypothetical protein
MKEYMMPWSLRRWTRRSVAMAVDPGWMVFHILNRLFAVRFLL